MKPTVTELGVLFPRVDFAFSVHSVFGTAVNLKTDSDPYLFSLIKKSGAFHPRSALAQFEGEFTDYFEMGEKGFKKGELLEVVPSKGQRFDFSGAKSRKEALPHFHRHEVNAVLFLEKAKDFLSLRQDSKDTLLRLKDLENIPPAEFSRTFASGASRLKDEFEAGVRTLLGLGQGLTPSGDDFLVGWLAGKRALGSRPSLIPFLSLTNEISASFLAGASEGFFPSALIGFIGALVRQDEADLVTSLETLADLGHSSGLDAASGVLYALF